MIPAIRLAALTVCCIGVAACLGETAPRRVLAGTTFSFPFSTAMLAGALPVAYGAVPASNAGTVLTPDLQRGNARFVLCTNPEPNCGTQRSLSFRYISRVSPDRGSRIGRSAVLDTPTGPMDQALTGQDVVVLDVPASTPSGTYQLTYVLRRPGATTDQRLTLQPITVVTSSTSAFTNITRAINFAGFNLTSTLQGLVPDPQLSLSLVDLGSATNLTDRPASGTLVLRHPPTVRIEGAFEAGVLGQGSLVRVSPGPVANTVSILFLDPDRKTAKLRVAFTLLPSATAPALTSQFSIDSQRLYGTDGAELPITTNPAAVGNSFRIDPAIL